MSPPGPIRVVSSGRRGAPGFGPVVGYAGFSSVLGRSHPNWDATVVGRARGQVPVANLRRVCGVARSREPGRSAKPWSAARVRPSGRAVKAQEGRGREADPTAFGTCSEEALRNPREHRPGRASARAGTDPCREQCPGAAGHRDLLVLRAEERDVRNGKRATAPKGVRTCGGGKL
jgi:hypothetical protein